MQGQEQQEPQTLDDLPVNMRKAVEAILELDIDEQMNIIRGTLGQAIRFHEYVTENNPDFEEEDTAVKGIWFRDLALLRATRAAVDNI